MASSLALERKAAYPLREPEDDTWARLHAIADAAEPSVRRKFLEAIAQLRGSVDIDALSDALARGDLGAVLDAIDWSDLKEALDAVQESLEAVREKAFDLTTREAEPRLDRHQLQIVRGDHLQYVPHTGPGAPPPPPAKPTAKLIVTFGQLSEDVIAAIRANGASRMVDVSDETRRAVQQLVERAYAAGKAPKTIEKELRGIIGLTRRQEQAVENYRAAQLDGGVTPDRAEKLADKYAAKLLKRRAQMVARTETLQAMNDGRRSSWQLLVEKGLLDPNGMEREWMTILDGRECVVCEGLDGERAPIGGTFVEGRIGPPEHPDCRCTEKLVLVESPAES